MRDNVEEGGITELNLGSSGQVLDAFSGRQGSKVKQIREQGYYIGRGERDPEITGIAAPILGHEGELVGVIALSGLISRFTDENVRILPEIEIQAIGVYAVWPPNAPKGGLTSRFVEHLIITHNSHGSGPEDY